MRLVEIKLENFRCYQQETSIPVSDLTAIIGRNDSGKSAIFDALAVFFEDAKLDRGDANVHSDNKNVRITCVFEDLPRGLVIDADYEIS